MRVIGVHAETHRRCPRRTRVVICNIDARRLSCNAQSWARSQVVETELDVGTLERHVRAALNIRRAAIGIIDRLAINRDSHQVQAKRILRTQLACHARDVHTVVVVEDRQLIVDNLHRNVRGVALHEAGIDDVIRVHETATFELGLLRARLICSATCSIARRARDADRPMSSP